MALESNTTGVFNTAVGLKALLKNTTGTSNTAIGLTALSNNSSGISNTAVGVNALINNSTGGNNIALGVGAGAALTTGNNNIDIGNGGVAAEANTILIGHQGSQTATFIAGISGISVTGDAVVVSNTGQLGIVVSSARYKRDIHDMDAVSDNLMKLRPVTFRYKSDPTGTRQYGLIAEEVARMYPELVTIGADGRVESVHYHELIPMLLNEIQKQAEQIKRLNAKVAEGSAARASFEQRLSNLERTLAVKEQNQTLAANGR